MTFVILVSSLQAQSAGPRPGVNHPDFHGTYAFSTLTPIERPAEFAGKPYLTEAEAASYVNARIANQNADRRSSDSATDLQHGTYNEIWYDRSTTLLRVDGKFLTSRVVDPPDGRIPALTPNARQRVAFAEKRRSAGPADGPENRSLPERCLSPAPLMTTGGEANLLTIAQTRDHVVIYAELLGVRRIISLARTTHLPQSIRSRSGDSIGRWEGDTLVVDTTNFTGDFGFQFAAVDENLHLTERFRRTADDGILYEARIDDPTAYVQPWTMVLVFNRTDARMFEFACHEGNYSMTHILQAARSAEKQ